MVVWHMAYFPNGSCPGAAYFDQECATCPHGEEACPVAAIHLIHNYNQQRDEKFRSALSLLVTDDGECQMRKLIIAPPE